MSYNYVTVQGKYESSTGIPGVGRVEWWTTSPVVDSVAHLTLTEPIDELTLDVTGAFSQTLLATDNTNLSVFGWGFRPFIAGVSDEIQLFTVTFLTLGATAWIDELGVYSP